MDHIELTTVLLQKCKGIRAMKLKGIVFLWPIVHADHFKAGTMVAHPRPTRATKEIQQSHLVLP
jgi:hypothetical protein